MALCLIFPLGFPPSSVFALKVEAPPEGTGLEELTRAIAPSPLTRQVRQDSVSHVGLEEPIPVKDFNALVVDDDPGLLNFRKRLLKRIFPQIDPDKQILSASNFSEAKQIIERQSIHLGIFDLNLGDPQGTGLDLADYIKRLSPGTVVVLNTGDARSDVKWKGMDVDQLLEKGIIDSFHEKGADPLEHLIEFIKQNVLTRLIPNGPPSSAPGVSVGLEEDEEFRQGFLAQRDYSQVRAFLWSWMSRREGNPVSALMRLFLEENRREISRFSSNQRTNAFRWIVHESLPFRHNMAPWARNELYRLFRHLATQGRGLVSMQSEAVEGLQVLASRFPVPYRREEELEILAIADRIWERAAQMLTSERLEIKDPGQRVQERLLEIVGRLRIPEAEGWLAARHGREELDSVEPSLTVPAAPSTVSESGLEEQGFQRLLLVMKDGLLAKMLDDAARQIGIKTVTVPTWRLAWFAWKQAPFDAMVVDIESVTDAMVNLVGHAEWHGRPMAVVSSAGISDQTETKLHGMVDRGDVVLYSKEPLGASGPNSPISFLKKLNQVIMETRESPGEFESPATLQERHLFHEIQSKEKSELISFLRNELRQGRDLGPYLKGLALNWPKWQALLKPRQRDGIMQWLLERLDSVPVGDPSIQEEYVFFRDVVNRPKDLVSVREKAFEGMLRIALADPGERGKEKRNDVLTVVQSLRRESLDGPKRNAASPVGFRRFLESVAGRLKTPEAERWLSSIQTASPQGMVPASVANAPLKQETHSGLEEAQKFRKEILARKERGAIQRYLWALWREDKPVVRFLSHWFYQRKQWRALQWYQRKDIFRWLVRFVEDERTPVAQKVGLFHLFQDAAVDQDEKWFSIRTWALRGMGEVAGNSEERTQVLKVVQRLWEEALSLGEPWKVLEYAKLELLRTAWFLEMEESRAWIEQVAPYYKGPYASGLEEDSPRILQGHEGPVRGVAFSPDGSIVTGGDDGTVQIWRKEAARPSVVLAHFQGGEEKIGRRSYHGVLDVAFNPDGRRIASAGWDGTVRVWRWEGGPFAVPEAVIPAGQSVVVTKVAFSPDGTTLAFGDSDHRVRLFALGKGEPTFKVSLPAGEDFISALAFSPDGQRFAFGSGGRDPKIRVWNPDRLDSPSERILSGHTDQVTGLAFLGDGRTLVSAGRDGTLRLWDMETGQEQRREEETNMEVNPSPIDRPWIRDQTVGFTSLALNPSLPEPTVAVGRTDGAIGFWFLRNGKEYPFRLKTEQEGVTAVAFSPDGRTLASAGADGTVRLWKLPSPMPIEADAAASTQAAGAEELSVKELAEQVRVKGFGFVNGRDRNEYPADVTPEFLADFVRRDLLAYRLIPKFDIRNLDDRLNFGALGLVRERNPKAVLGVALDLAVQADNLLNDVLGGNLILSAPISTIEGVVRSVEQAKRGDRVLVIAKVQSWDHVLDADRGGARGIEIEPAAEPRGNLEKTRALLDRIAEARREGQLKNILVWGSAGGITQENSAQLASKGYIAFSVGPASLPVKGTWVPSARAANPDLHWQHRVDAIQKLSRLAGEQGSKEAISAIGRILLKMSFHEEDRLREEYRVRAAAAQALASLASNGSTEALAILREFPAADERFSEISEMIQKALASATPATPNPPSPQGAGLEEGRGFPAIFLPAAPSLNAQGLSREEIWAAATDPDA